MHWQTTSLDLVSNIFIKAPRNVNSNELTCPLRMGQQSQCTKPVGDLGCMPSAVTLGGAYDGGGATRLLLLQ